MSSRQVALCLACSSSPSPRAQLSPPFTTSCCIRPICERCLSRNPRLRGYNPCLACLAGVAVVGQSGALNGKPNVHVARPGPSGQSENQERTIFVLGDSDDEEADTNTLDVPPPYMGAAEITPTPFIDETRVADSIDVEIADGEGSNPSKYCIQPGDSLRGIALRYGIDGRKICQINSLPFSTLSTTPHLLHTRRWLNLPPTGRPMLPPDPKILEAHNRERAEKRFQFVTKEIDWRVAKAYVALAEDEDDSTKTKESIQATIKAPEQRTLEAKAVDQYLDDGEWETGQTGGPRLQGFPPFKSPTTRK
ncbi:hypothetical protein JB92DRAFT_2689461 [Gautieria morchelliformis]|nr:hypothetical protein JB92DRAFT_2689461 [Gautieria morchelliformis]